MKRVSGQLLTLVVFEAPEVTERTELTVLHEGEGNGAEDEVSVFNGDAHTVSENPVLSHDNHRTSSDGATDHNQRMEGDVDEIKEWKQLTTTAQRHKDSQRLFPEFGF